MGQCMDISVGTIKIHPFLGYLTEYEQKKVKYLKMNLPIANEEDYLNWSKNINKLRYNLEIKDYLYLPLSEVYKSGQGMCENLNALQLTFHPYHENLKETLGKYIKNKLYFHQTYVWYLIYVLVKYINYFQKKQQEINLLFIENILLWQDGSIKIIPENIIPNYEWNTAILYADDQNNTNDQIFDNISTEQKDHYPNVYIIGLICLCVADLLNPNQFYDNSRYKWRGILPQAKKGIIEHCQIRYSALLVQTLGEMTEISNEKRISVSQLCKRLQIYESEIISKRQFGFNLNINGLMQQSTKTQCYNDNKSVVMNNNSNLLKISNTNIEQASFSSAQLLKRISSSYYASKQDFLNIL